MGAPKCCSSGRSLLRSRLQGQVLVKVFAAALNRVDLWVRAGWPGIKLAYPHILGSDGAGEIAALGPGVTGVVGGGSGGDQRKPRLRDVRSLPGG